MQYNKGGHQMIPDREWPCWQLMQCNHKESCPAWQNPEKPCWQIASELDDYRNAYRICQDCIVYMLKNGASSLSQEEVHRIMQRKISCAMVP
jgi:hypothetical protein